MGQFYTENEPHMIIRSRIHVKSFLQARGTKYRAHAVLITRLNWSTPNMSQVFQDANGTRFTASVTPGPYVGMDVNGQRYSFGVTPSVATLATLPTATPAGQLLVVTDANTGAGALCYSDGSIWKDAATHAQVV